MTGRVVVMRQRGLIMASGDADAVKAKHDGQHSKAFDPGVVHGWNVVNTHMMPPHAAVVNRA